MGFHIEKRQNIFSVDVDEDDWWGSTVCVFSVLSKPRDCGMAILTRDFLNNRKAIPLNGRSSVSYSLLCLPGLSVVTFTQKHACERADG